MEQDHKSYSEEEISVLVQSMCGPMASKIKLVMKKALKNRQLGENVALTALIDLLLEQLIPQFCVQNFSNSKNVNLMHNLVYLLQMKVQTVFTSGVIRTCIDQNWDLKGLKAVILRILKILDIEEQDRRISTLFDKLVQSQNLQSQACIKAIAYFLKNSRKSIEEDDLRNPILTYQTTFNFVKDDIQHFRNQKMKPSCFSVLHPWAYDLDSVDFKYIVNRDLVSQVCQKLTSRPAQVFWLSFFKSQLSCSADEFFTAIKELSEINLMPAFFSQKLEEYKGFMQKCDYVVSVNDHADFIQDFVHQFYSQSQEISGFCVLRDQVRTVEGNRNTTEYIDEEKIKVYSVYDEPSFSLFSKDGLKDMKFICYKPEQLRSSIQIFRRVIAVDPPKTSNKKLTLKFISVDTDELQGTEITYSGSNSFYKVGEGDLNHYQILNDKKLWESQFMLVFKNGQFYIRDLGIVHTSRVKVDKGLEVQLQRGSVVDMGKVIHYHFDKVTTKTQPQTDSDKSLLVMRPHEKYVVEDDDPVLRARPTWVSQDENKDMIQNEILITVDEGKNIFSVGRSVKRDIEIKLKAVSADHCTIAYTDNKGWIIHENGKEKPSSNGTFVFMKSQTQMDDHEPSALIPLHDGMILSFINYELQVQLAEKDQDEILLEEDERKRRNQKIQEEMQSDRYQQNFDQTYNQKVAGKLYEDQQDPKKQQDLEQQKIYDEKMYGEIKNDNVIKAPQVKEFDMNDRADQDVNAQLEEEERKKEQERLEVLKKQKDEEERLQQEETAKQEEYARQQQEEENARLKSEQQEQERLKQQQEEEKRQQELEDQRKKQEEEQKKQQDEELKRQQEEEESKRQQEEEEKQRLEDQEKRNQQELEEKKRQEEEEQLKIQKEQQEQALREEEAKRQQEEESRKQQEAEDEEMRKRHEAEEEEKRKQHEAEEEEKRKQEEHEKAELAKQEEATEDKQPVQATPEKKEEEKFDEIVHDNKEEQSSSGLQQEQSPAQHQQEHTPGKQDHKEEQVSQQEDSQSKNKQDVEEHKSELVQDSPSHEQSQDHHKQDEQKEEKQEEQAHGSEQHETKQNKDGQEQEEAKLEHKEEEKPEPTQVTEENKKQDNVEESHEKHHESPKAESSPEQKKEEHPEQAQSSESKQDQDKHHVESPKKEDKDDDKKADEHQQ